MDSFEVVVGVPADWGEERIDELEAALKEALARFPGVSVDARVSSPGLVAQMDQLAAQVRDQETRIKETEARVRWLSSRRGPLRVWAFGLLTGFLAGLAAAYFLG